jgi:hypothetical protein
MGDNVAMLSGSKTAPQKEKAARPPDFGYLAWSHDSIQRP